MVLSFEQFKESDKKIKESNNSRKIILFEDYDEGEDEEDEEDGELDLSEISWKMDKYMPEDQEIQEEYHSILDNENLSREEKISELEEFFELHADEERLFSYLGKNRTLKDLVTYIVDKE